MTEFENPSFSGKESKQIKGERTIDCPHRSSFPRCAANCSLQSLHFTLFTVLVFAKLGNFIISNVKALTTSSSSNSLFPSEMTPNADDLIEILKKLVSQIDGLEGNVQGLVTQSHELNKEVQLTQEVRFYYFLSLFYLITSLSTVPQ